MCLSLASDSSETVEVIIVKLGMVTASDRRMHQCVNYIDLDLQDQNHENNKCLII